MSQTKTPHTGRTQLSENTVNRMLDHQQREQELRAAELKIRQDELQAQAGFANKVLEAQIHDRNHERQHVTKMTMIRMGIGGLLAVVAALVITYWLHIGKDQLASDVAKMLISAAFGAVGGYGLRATRDRQLSKQNAQEVDQI